MFVIFISIRSKRDEINELREGVLEKANERGVRLQQEYQLQEFKFDTQEVKQKFFRIRFFFTFFQAIFKKNCITFKYINLRIVLNQFYIQYFFNKRFSFFTDAQVKTSAKPF